jgi:hypothetical protein
MSTASGMASTMAPEEEFQMVRDAWMEGYRSVVPLAEALIDSQ